MVRSIGKPVLALVAVLAVGGLATAHDPLRTGGTSPGKSKFDGTTMTLAGKGTVADAAAAEDDLELTHGRYYGGYRGYSGGYRGWGGGYHYRPYYNYYRPYYPVNYYRPYYYNYTYYRP